MDLSVRWKKRRLRKRYLWPQQNPVYCEGESGCVLPLRDMEYPSPVEAFMESTNELVYIANEKAGLGEALSTKPRVSGKRAALYVWTELSWSWSQRLLRLPHS